MRLLLLLLIIPTVSALRIAASPDSVHLDANGEGVLRLFNPNDELVEYSVDGVWIHKGELDAGASDLLHVVNNKFYGDSVLNIQFRNSKGSDKIAVQSGLHIPVSRLRPAIPAHNQLAMFSVIFLVSLIILGIGFVITSFL